MHWTVQHVVVKEYTEEEAGLAYLSVVLAEQPGPGGRHIEFQLALDDDEREEGYCVMDAAPPTYDGDPVALALAVGTHRTLYGGIKECRLDNNALILRLSWKAQRTFRWPRTLKLGLALSADQHETLQRGLVEVLVTAPRGERPPRVLV